MVLCLNQMVPYMIHLSCWNIQNAAGFFLKGRHCEGRESLRALPSPPPPPKTPHSSLLTFHL